LNYVLHIAILMEIYVILSLSLNLVVGYAGMLSLCHAAFYGFGAYAAALLMKGGLGLPATHEFLLVLPAAVALTVLFSGAVSLPFLKLRGDYLAMASIGIQTIVFVLIYNLTWLTRGAFGISDIPELRLFGREVTSFGPESFSGHTPSFFIFSSGVTAACVWLLYRVGSSPFARDLKAVREDELAAASLGKNVAGLKVGVFALAAGFAAVAGVLFTGYSHYVDPTGFTLMESVLILSMLIVGGAGNFKGPLLGTALIIGLPELLRYLSVPEEYAPNVRQMVDGALILLLMRYRARGLAGEYSFG
jgi:branched-chain amino acid transport system permease protein